ncbi:MAG: FlgD immunoglobulin-like domain containing protein [Candidatus Eisenbacteria bacterium]
MTSRKHGTAFGGTGTTVDLHDSVITGQGPTAIIAQNCVQYAAGAAGSIARCSVSNSVYTPNSVTSTGILLFGAGTMTLTDLNGANGVDNCQTGIYALDTNATIDGLDISTSVAAPESYGVYFYNTSASFNGPGSTGTPGEHARRVQAMDYASLEEHGGTPLLTAMSGSVTNACMDGFDVPFSTGISAYSAGGPLTVTATYDKVRNFDYGCWVGGTGAVLTANNNEIASNLTAGYDNTFTGAAQNAEQNWWGDAAGPAGAGDDVLGPNVDYTPWRISGASATPCAFTPTFNNQVGPVAPSGCISIANSCVAVPFTIARTDNAPLRGFSATFQLGGGLTLCGANIVFGSYLIGGTHYEIVNNGGGSYTVDGTTLGSPCGTTTPTGTLFTAYVTAPGVGTGTVTMTNLLLRDCDNAPIAATMGAPISITIDNVAPVAVANLASAQKKTGNDSNGTTKIQLTFTAPGDAATTEVYRKGYGQYPEYDDCAGSGVPTLPTYVTLGAQGWTLTGVTATGQYDEPATRDFWYYVVFTKDACGNVSSVSNLAGGTLNYHLGDVSDGVTPGAGDNLVNAVDISLLGAHYGITLSPTCGAAFNYLDVGPTTDFSVNARPTTDNKVNFEDLIMFAINYGTVSFNGPSSNGDLAGSGARGEQPKLALAFDPQTPAGMMNGTLTARLNLIDNVSATKGIHGVVAFDRARLELVNSTEGTWLAQQNPFWKAIADEKGIAIDAAALGNGVTLHGSGEVAVLTFRVKQAGARPTLATSDLRDADNRFLADRPAGADLAQDLTSSREATVTTALDVLTARPNPFQGTTEIAFSLAAAGPVELRIYDAGGRAVRTLLHGAMGAGSHALVWDGRTDDGIKVGPGVYFSALRTQDRELSRKLLLVR